MPRVKVAFDPGRQIPLSAVSKQSSPHFSRWTWTDRSETSGMAVLQYTVPSGYMVTNYDMRNLVQASTIPNLRHIWMVGQYLNIFFSNISSVQQTCITINIPRWHPVANTTVEQPCNVFEYFEYSNRNFSFYSSRSLHSNDICKVCGSFQCPYCIDYNGAPVTLAPTFVLLSGLLVLAALAKRAAASSALLLIS